jgi:hypothetical protein
VGAELVNEERAELKVPVEPSGGLEAEMETARLGIEARDRGPRELGDPWAAEA